jgi:hypothetical protein
MTTNGTKYTFVCDPNNCDTLIEVTCPSGFDFPNGVVQLTCPCGRNMSYISATILPTTTKEEAMEYPYNNPEETTQVLALQELILKKDEQIVRLQNANSTYSTDANVQYGRINRVKDYLTENYDELEMHADEIANILQIELSREVTYTVTMTATVTVSVPVGEDGEDILNENLYIDANHGDIVIDSYDVDSISEDY